MHHHGPYHVNNATVDFRDSVWKLGTKEVQEQAFSQCLHNNYSKGQLISMILKMRFHATKEWV